MIPAKTNLHHLLEQAAASTPTAPALIYRDDTVSYGDLWNMVRQAGSGLRRLGGQPNERVAVFIEKRFETVTAIFAASAASAVCVPINPLLKPTQVGYILRNCDVSVLITSAERLAQLATEISASPALTDVIVVGGSAQDTQPPLPSKTKVHDWNVFANGTADLDAATPRAETDLAAILYTSGSTGKPKGVMVSHRNLLVGARSVSQYLGNTAQDTILSVLPLSFDAGLSQLTTAFNVGARVVLMNYLLANDVVRLCRKHGVTGITAVPPFWIQVADLDWPPDVAARLRYFANTGGRMPRATLTRLRRHFSNAMPYLMYGLTEAFRSTYLPPAEVDRRPDSIGKAIPNAEILVLRPDGTPCGPGEEGELVHCGPLVSLGYWNDPEKTAEKFRPAPGHANGANGANGARAVFSGDTVVKDADGFLFFVGRRDEMIKTSGYRVSPTEVEEVAYATGLIRDAVALGIDDPLLGQRVVLVASPSGDGELAADRLLAAMRRDLPLYMVPSQVIAMAAIPTSPNGKFDRVLLREQVAS